MYLSAVEDAFSGAIDFAQLVKVYGASPEGPEVRYSPAACLGTQEHAVTGCPDAAHVSTSYVERANLTIRMSIRRFTRLTNAFSKKVENHTAALGLFSAHYNLCRIHKTLRVTPAMSAGVSDHVWSVEELVALLPEVEPKKSDYGSDPALQMIPAGSVGCRHLALQLAWLCVEIRESPLIQQVDEAGLR